MRNGTPETIDFVVVRENSEGEYAGLGGRNLAARGADREVAIQSALFTAHGCERIIRYAFELAGTRPRRKVTSVTKSNAQQYAMTLWDDIFARVSLDYPDIETESILVDAMAAKMVLRPEAFDVIVGSNLFGDILSDLGGAIAGSLGIAASANIDPRATLSVDVRAGARLRAGYRRARHRQSDRGGLERGHDAGASGLA